MSSRTQVVVASVAVGVVSAVALAVLLFFVLRGLDDQRPKGDQLASAGPQEPRFMTPVELRALRLNVLPPVPMPPDNPLTDAKAELGQILRQSKSSLKFFATYSNEG